MNVKIKDIPGALVEVEHEIALEDRFGFRTAITLQGEVQIGMNKGKLWDILEEVNPACGERIRQAYINAILSDLKGLLEVKK